MLPVLARLDISYTSKVSVISVAKMIIVSNYAVTGNKSIHMAKSLYKPIPIPQPNLFRYHSITASHINYYPITFIPEL